MSSEKSEEVIDPILNGKDQTQCIVNGSNLAYDSVFSSKDNECCKRSFAFDDRSLEVS